MSDELLHGLALTALSRPTASRAPSGTAPELSDPEAPARRCVRRHARDEDDAALLLAVLGLDEPDEER